MWDYAWQGVLNPNITRTNKTIVLKLNTKNDNIADVDSLREACMCRRPVVEILENYRKLPGNLVQKYFSVTINYW